MVSSAATIHPLYSAPAVPERRAVPRKPLRRRATLRLADNIALTGQTVDLSSGGVRVSVDRAFSVPQECEIEFTMLMDGQLQAIKSRARILSCVCTEMTFSIGLQFVQIDDAGKAALERYLAR